MEGMVTRVERISTTEHLFTIRMKITQSSHDFDILFRAFQDERFIKLEEAGH